MTAIAFTYDISTLIGRTRLYAGDTDGEGLNRTGGDRTRTDAEIAFLLGQNGNDVRGAAAELLETRAAEYAQQALRSDQGTLTQDFRERSSKCLEAARALRSGVASPVLQSAPSEAIFTAGSPDGVTPGTMDRW